MLNNTFPIAAPDDDTLHDSTELNLHVTTDTKPITAFTSLPLIIQHQLLDHKRVVLIANNPSITRASLAALLQPTDIVVLFNDFIHADFFASHPRAKRLPKMLFFRQMGDSKLHFGLPPRSNNVAAISEMIKQAPLGLLLGNTSYQFPVPTDDPNPDDDPITDERILTIPKPLNDLLLSDKLCCVLSERHAVVADYPYFADIHSSAPTSGFLLYRLLLAARRHMLLSQPTHDPLNILLLGFNDEDKTAHFWEGHNWAFERQELANPPPNVDIIRQY